MKCVICNNKKAYKLMCDECRNDWFAPLKQNKKLF